jgi:hypothetical protein
MEADAAGELPVAIKRSHLFAVRLWVGFDPWSKHLCIALQQVDSGDVRWIEHSAVYVCPPFLLKVGADSWTCLFNVKCRPGLSSL